MDSRPIIGVTIECRYEPDDARTQGELTIAWNYAEEIAKAGGVPLIVPPQADMAAVAPLLDGWLIPGGADIDAARFGQDNHPEVQLQDPRRYASESSLYEALDPNVPILGICYGCQFLNVKRGGTLEQHIPDRDGAATHTGGMLDVAAIDPDSHLGGIIGPTVEGRSYHHQAIEKVGDSLRIVGRHADGTVEAIEATDRPWVIGVQWHPERTPLDGATQRLFASFVSAAATYRSRRKEVSHR